MVASPDSLIKKWLVCLLSSAVSFSCSCQEGIKGTLQNPIQVSLVPSKETNGLLQDAKAFARWMEKETGYHFEVHIPTSYIAVVEALGSKRVDLAYLNTTTYFLAHEKYGAEVKFISINADGNTEYRGQILVRDSSPIKTLKDLNGRTMAFVDPTSASGYILPGYLLRTQNIKPSREVFAGRHDSVVMMVYQGQVDAGATFYSSPENGKPMDARRLVQAQYPDVWTRLRILGFTQSLANDAFVFRQDLDGELKEVLESAMMKWAQTPEGKVTLKALNNASGLRKVTDKDYEPSRKILREMQQVLNQPQ